MLKRKIFHERNKNESATPKKTVTVARQTILFTILFVVFLAIGGIAVTNFAILITGFTELDKAPTGIILGLNLLTYIVALYMSLSLLFGTKAKRVILKGHVPKLVRNISLVFVVTMILFIGINILTFGLVLTYVVFDLVILTVGLFAIRKIFVAQLKIRALYMGICIMLLISIGTILFFVSERANVITTGRFGYGTEEYNQLANQLFGSENAEERFHIYFNWFNVIHEIGHAIVRANNTESLHPVDEELLVNEFAVAFLTHHGEQEKLELIEDIVSYARKQVNPPVENMTHIEYARANWGRGDFFSFNNYGWFQFNVVYYALQEARSLEEILSEMGVENITTQPEVRFIYDSFGEDMVEKIIYDSVYILREWGAIIPPIYHRFSENPATHNLLPTRNVFGMLDRFHSLAIGN